MQDKRNQLEIHLCDHPTAMRWSNACEVGQGSLGRLGCFLGRHGHPRSVISKRATVSDLHKDDVS